MISRLIRLVSSALVIVSVVFAWAVYFSAPSQAQAVTLSPKELFFYDAEGRKQPLPFLPKLTIQYINSSDVLGEMGENSPITVITNRFRERSSLLPLSVIRADSALLTWTVSFLPNTSFEELMTALSAVREPGVVEVAPVFLVERRVVSIDGIAIDMKTELSSQRVESFLKGVLGNVAIKNVRVETDKAVVRFEGFFFSGTKIPLDILTLTNLLNGNEDAKLWLTRARPNFIFLDEPLSVSLSVSPVTGTVGEERTVVLTVRVRDSTITVNEDVLPVFGEGNFAPSIGDSLPDSAFFVVSKNPVKRRFSDEFGDVIERRWTFYLFAAEKEWTVAPVAIFYKQGNENKTVRTASYTFATLLHTAQSIDVKDMPTPQLLPRAETFLSQVMKTDPDSFSADLPKYWFDVILGGKEHATLTRTAKIAGMLLLLLGVLLFAAQFMRARMGLRDGVKERQKIAHELSELKNTYREGRLSLKADYSPETMLANLETNIGKAFRVVFLDVPGKQFSLQLIMENAPAGSALKEFITGNTELLKKIFETINKRHAAHCLLSDGEYEVLMARASQLFESLLSQYQKKEAPVPSAREV